jgi:DNA-binding NarL/FixJ family response regulator
VEAARRVLAKRQMVDLGALPDEPFDLRGAGVAAIGDVADEASIRSSLLAAARGAPLVVRVSLPPGELLAYLDDLARLADVRLAAPVTGERLTADKVALLRELAAGRTVNGAAERLGWSRRTATRRLSDAKDRLGVATTAEALQSLRSSR